LTIEAQSTLGASLLSQAFGSASANPTSVIPPKEPITTESTDASERPKTTEDENLSITLCDITKVFLILQYYVVLTFI